MLTWKITVMWEKNNSNGKEYFKHLSTSDRIAISNSSKLWYSGRNQGKKMMELVEIILATVLKEKKAVWA